MHVEAAIAGDLDDLCRQDSTVGGHDDDIGLQSGNLLDDLGGTKGLRGVDGQPELLGEHLDLGGVQLVATPRLRVGARVDCDHVVLGRLRELLKRWDGK